MQTIIVDLGGVLVTETSQIRDAAKLLGVAPHDVARRYWAERDVWDACSSNLDYWGAVAAGAGIEIDADVADRLARHDAELWTTLRPAARALLAELHEAPAPVWVLSNAAAVFDEVIAASDWAQFVDGWFVSGSLGMVKPDADIYAHVETSLGVEPDALYFVDDRPANVATAQARGWHTHLWSSDEETRRWLVEIGALDA